MLASSRLAREVARRVTLIVCNAEHLKDRLVRSLQVVPSRVHVIRNAVALNARNSEWDWRAALGIPASAWVACMPANLTPYKDHVTVLHAWQRVAAWAAQQGRAAVLLLAGYFGATANALKRLEYELELTPFIRFLGRVDDVAGVLSAADLCVFASASEGSPNGVLEAMAAGLPVAATEEPGVREALGAAADRQLAPRQPESLGALIASHLSSPEQRRQLGAENRLRIETAYLERRSGEEMANLLVEALARNH
jgi:glycosyltransferase involved in cell wall biosynthesis